MESLIFLKKIKRYNTYYVISAAVYAAYFAAPYSSVTAYDNAQNERLQSLLYFIETE